MLNSCNNANHSQIQIDENNLKQVVDEKNKTLQWTQELEKGRLSQKIDSIDYIKSSIELSPKTMIAFESSLSRAPVFPLLDDFASLDISDLDETALFVINQFCSKINDIENCQNFMDSNSIFSLVLFLYDLEQLDFNLENFTWIIGQPFILENTLEVPVRLKNANKFVDVKFYLTNSLIIKQKSDDAENNQQKQDKELTKQKDTLKYRILDIEIEKIKEIAGGQ